MEKLLKLQNQFLSVDIRLPGSEPQSERFDSSAVVKQVVLNGKHCFCQPEQIKKDRVTCWGFGLCAEYDMNAIAAETRKYEHFPKPGVGILTQIEDGKPYDMWSHYDIKRFAKTWESGSDWIVFKEEPFLCLGIALRIKRRLRLKENCIVLTTEIENIGERRAVFSEYQHNFVAIDDIPINDGYCLEIPFDGKLDELMRSFRTLPSYEPVKDSSLYVKGCKALWCKPMDERTYHKVTLQDDILDCSDYYWTLSHRDVGASVTERMDFKPWKLVLWGIEHCISTEVYCLLDIQPGASQSYTRTWCFDDEVTKGGKA